MIFLMCQEMLTATKPGPIFAPQQPWDSCSLVWGRTTKVFCRFWGLESLWGGAGIRSIFAPFLCRDSDQLEKLLMSFPTRSSLTRSAQVVQGTSHYLRPGGSGVKRLFMGNIFAAYSACEENNSRPTRRRMKIFRCLLL